MGSIFQIPWNVKADKFVNCWRCDHFQRFDSKENPTLCVGECRRLAPRGWLEDEDYIDEYGWPFIWAGPIYWCSFYEPTTERPVPNYPSAPPQPPPSPPQQAAEGGVGIVTYCYQGQEFEFPDDYYLWQVSPWNRKLSQNVSCWHCDHFQRYFEDPSDIPQGQEPCKGECRKNPPESIIRRGIPHHSTMIWDWMRGYSRPLLLGAKRWCSEFERSTRPVPPIPTFDNELCPPYLGPGSQIKKREERFKKPELEPDKSEKKSKKK